MSIDWGEAESSQRDRVLALLSDLEWHSFKELNRVGGIRYGARLLELERLGYRIEDREPGDKTAGKDYRLLSMDRGKPQEKRVKVLLTERDAAGILEGSVTETAHSAIMDAWRSFNANRGKL